MKFLPSTSIFIFICALVFPSAPVSAQSTGGIGIQPIVRGGTGATTAAQARLNLGVGTALPGPVFNVRDYGAVLDGTTDDTTAIQNAINAAAAAGGGVVYFSGIGKISSALTITSSVGLTLRGGDRNTCGVKGSTQSLGILINVTGSNVTLENIKIDGSYVSGSTSGFLGLLGITAASNVTVRYCLIANSLSNGIGLLGACTDVSITSTRFQNNFLAFYSLPDPAADTVPQRTTISHCTIVSGWCTDGNSQSGGIKMAGQWGGELFNSVGHNITDNTIIDAGCLSIELWGGGGRFKDCLVARNNILGTRSGDLFGISLNDCHRVKAVDNIIRFYNAYIGMEVANDCLSVSLDGNKINLFQSDNTTYSSGTGISINNNSGSGPTLTVVHDNEITGCGTAVQNQKAEHTVIEKCQFYSCYTGVFNQGSSYVTINGNYFAGNFTTYFYLDGTAYDLTDIEIAYNQFTGDSSYRSFWGYNNNGTHTLTNFRFHHNMAYGATFSGYDSWWLGWDADEMINCRRHDNYYVAGAGKVEWPDWVSNDLVVTGDAPPFDRSLQQFSIPIAKNYTFAVPASSGDQWFKIFSIDYGLPIVLALHVRCNFLDTADNTASAQTFIVSASPYGQSQGIMKLPDGRYNGGSLKGIVYQNLSSAIQEIWLHFPPTAGGNVTVGAADYATSWISNPTAVTTEPTWTAYSYELPTQTDPASLKSRYIASDVFSGIEQAATPSAPSANGFKLYAKDKAGKTALYVLFPSGAEQEIKVEP